MLVWKYLQIILLTIKKEVFVISIYVLKIKIKQLNMYKYVNIYVTELTLIIFKIPMGKQLRWGTDKGRCFIFMLLFCFNFLPWEWDPVAAAPRLWSMGSVAVARGLSCVWGLPGPGIEPSSSALVCRFLTTEPPGKPITSFLALLVEAALPVVPTTPRSGERSPSLL